MSLIARLGVILGLDNKEFISGIDDATKKTREFEMNQKRALRNAQKAQDEFMTTAATGLAGVAAAALAIGKAFQYADQIEDTAKAFDTTTASLMAMQAAFVASGGDAENAGGALQKLAIAQQNAIDGSDELRESFSKLGISGQDVENLALPELFKRVAQELSTVENATQRTALQTELLGKAVKGTNWKDFVDNYKELGDPTLLAAIQENAKAWGNIEATFKELLNVIQKMIMPFAVLVNHISDIRQEYERLKKGGGAEIDFGAAFGGMPGEAIVGQYYDATRPNTAKSIAKAPVVGDYKNLSKKGQSDAKAAAEEEKRIQEARKALELEIKLIKEKADIADKMFAIDAKGITLGEAAIAQEKMILNLVSDLEKIRNDAAKERIKDKAEIDLINAKEKAAIDARVKQFGIENGLRQKALAHQHQLAIQAIRDESNSRANAMRVEIQNELNLLDLESERFKLGSEAYQIQKLQVEEKNKLREIDLKAQEAVQQISREYELSAKSAQDLQLYEENLLKIRYDTVRQIAYTQAIEQKKQKNLEEQLKTEKELFALDLAQQKGRDIANIQSTLNIEKMRLDLESDRYRMSTNVYNLSNLALDNVYRLIEAEKKYNDQIKQAEYEMQRQGGGQKAREEYEQRIKTIEEVRDIELDAIRQINDARQQNLEKEIYRQRSFVDGWYYAAKQFQENSQNAFKRGEAAFQNVMNGMDAAISNFVETGKFKFEDFALSVIKNLIRMEMQAQATELFKSMVDMFTFNVASPLPDFSMQAVAGLRGKASGGAINSPTIVGENGAELFIPSTPGTIVPNGSWQQAAANMGKSGFVNNGTYIANMSAIDTQSATQFIASNKNTIWAAYQSANRSIPISR